MRSAASGEKINWVNYKTGIKTVRLAMQADEQKAIISLNVADEELFTRSFLPLRQVFESMVGTDWIWELGKISATLPGKDIRRQQDWPEVIAFFKERLIALDAFGDMIKEAIK